MSISVVTVVLNAGCDLSLTIESVRRQDYRDLELIVVDGGSHDDTAAVLALYADVIDKVVRIEDAGIYHAMNVALDHCSHEYVLFLNAKDTLFDATVLSRLMKCKRADIDIFYGNHIYIQGGREYSKHSYDYELSMHLLFLGQIDHLWLSRLPGHQATFVRLELLRHLRFNTDIQISADHDLMVRAYASGARFQYIDEFVSHYVGGGFSAQRPNRLMLEWCALYREHSVEPAAVDAFFLGGGPSPFGPQNALTGILLSGDYPPEGPQPERGIAKQINWCRPQGVQMLTPSRGASTALRIEGFCPFDNQWVVFSHKDREVASLKLVQGWFKRSLAFSPTLEAGSIIDVVSLRDGEVSNSDSRIVGFALAEFKFEVSETRSSPLRRGERIAFSAENRIKTERLLGTGWGDQESEHIWTTSEQAELNLSLASDVRTIVLGCKGNPFIDDPEARGAEFSFDLQHSVKHLLERDTISELEIECPRNSPSDLTKLTLRPLTRLSPPNDQRLLGVCLISLECR